jgi:hypothetical protein
VVGKEAPGQDFSEYFGFSCQSSFHQMLHIHLSSGAATIGQLVADVPSEFSPTPPQEQKRKKKKKGIFILDVICLNLSRYFGHSEVFFS